MVMIRWVWDGQVGVEMVGGCGDSQVGVVMQ